MGYSVPSTFPPWIGSKALNFQEFLHFGQQPEQQLESSFALMAEELEEAFGQVAHERRWRPFLPLAHLRRRSLIALSGIQIYFYLAL